MAPDMPANCATPCQILVAAAIAVLGRTGPALAQARPAPDIVVAGAGLADAPATPAYDVLDIGREQILASASGRIEDVLSSVAGFQQFRRSDSRSANPTAQGVTLRSLGGNAASRALVLLDGVPMTDPFFGHVPLGAIAPETLARVRVTRGGGVGAFGAGALAGVIELTSAAARTLGLVDARALANQRGETELSASFAPKLARGFAVVSGRWDRGQGFYTTPADQRVAATARARFDTWSAGIRAVAPIGGEVELHARVQAFADHRTLRFDGADNATRGQDASLRLVGRGRWSFDLLGYVQLRDFSNVVISSTSFRKALDQRKTPATGIGGKFELRPPTGGGHVLRLGGDVRIASGELQEEPYGPQGLTALRRAGGRNSDIGLYLEDDWVLGALVVTAGVRADRWSIANGHYRETDPSGHVTAENRFSDRSGWKTSLRGGAVWNAGDGLALRAAAYGGYRLPTLNELYRPFVVFPVRTQANAGLASETNRGFEAGIDLRPAPDLSFSLTAFDNKVRNAIANVTIGPNLRERRNVDAIRARGVEAEAGLALGRLTLDASLALTDAKVLASGVSAALDGMRPAQTPRTMASTTLTWRPRERWRVAVTLRHVGAQFEDDLESERLPPATTVNAFAELPLGSAASLILRAENLMDKAILTRSQGGSIDLGAPRTIWAGLRFSLPH